MTVLTLRRVEVQTFQQVQLLRSIRNATAGTYTHYNDQISEQHQSAWWITMRGRIHAWLYYQQSLVGYGLIRQTDDGLWWDSVGVLPAYQGHGYGSAITADLAHQHDEPIYAAVLKDNLPAIAMHRAPEWEPSTGPDPKLIYFRSVPQSSTL